MKTTIPNLRRMVRNIILEHSSPGSWPEFIELVQDGNEESALMWLKELFDGSGVELTREWEDEFIMLGREGIWTELDRAWKVVQSGDY